MAVKKCEAPGCDRDISQNKLMCAGHWERVPAALPGTQRGRCAHCACALEGRGPYRARVPSTGPMLGAGAGCLAPQQFLAQQVDMVAQCVQLVGI